MNIADGESVCFFLNNSGMTAQIQLKVQQNIRMYINPDILPEEKSALWRKGSEFCF